MHGIGNQQTPVLRHHAEWLGNFAEAPFGYPIKGADQQAGSLWGQGFDTGFLYHAPQTRRAARM
ncbi:hypothetical protein NJB1907f3_04400 [Mycobacterium marinum]|nr:hypothetical protein NJB1728e24_06880 [Mycobacterium marinum]GJO42741.1 hypothetical protein NJB1907f3_04400 [Mycobacterium marinum]GJO77496.1 hypothetical protein NJB1728f31_10510 [Mycobacterium marinum]GJO95166.1 hypothetical protein NJB18001_01820 [Mycobacterium marinum]